MADTIIREESTREPVVVERSRSSLGVIIGIIVLLLLLLLFFGRGLFSGGSGGSTGGGASVPSTNTSTSTGQ